MPATEVDQNPATSATPRVLIASRDLRDADGVRLYVVAGTPLEVVEWRDGEGPMVSVPGADFVLQLDDDEFCTPAEWETRGQSA